MGVLRLALFVGWDKRLQLSRVFCSDAVSGVIAGGAMPDFGDWGIDCKQVLKSTYGLSLGSQENEG